MERPKINYVAVSVTAAIQFVLGVIILTMWHKKLWEKSETA
jgi:hypothetical protein